MHEKFDYRERIEIGSEKSFGITFSIIFLFFGILPAIIGPGPLWWAVAAGFLFLIFSVLFPSIFRPLNLVWFRFGLTLNYFVSPVILAMLFYLVITPIGLVLRVCKKDILNLKLDKSSLSYWIKSETSLSSMKDQF